MDFGGSQCAYNGDYTTANKRKRTDINNINGDKNLSAPNSTKEAQKKQSSFVQINGQRGVYYSEHWKPGGSTLYLPVCGTVLANLQKYEQISFEPGYFCIADESNRFHGRAQGHCLHCWRYNEQDKKLFIALSYFFTIFEVFQETLNSLECL